MPKDSNDNVIQYNDEVFLYVQGETCINGIEVMLYRGIVVEFAEHNSIMHCRVVHGDEYLAFSRDRAGIPTCVGLWKRCNEVTVD